MTFTVYILRSSSNELYIGQTNNLPKRLKEHITKSNRASKFTEDHNDFHLVYKEEYSILLEAMHREKQLKGWTRAKREALISGDMLLLKQL